MRTSLFYKSTEKDFPWLEYSRDSVRKFVSGFDEIVLCLPEGQTFDWPEAKIVHVRETFNPYGFQQLCKLYADTWCSGDFIVFQDSDTIWNKPTAPMDLFQNGKPFWPIRPFGDVRADQQVWRDVIRKYMKEEPVFEGMSRHPFVVWNKSLVKLRAHCQMMHDCSLGEYIEQQFIGTTGAALNFSEWNILSAFCLKHHSEMYHWIDLSKEQAPEACCWQGFSHGGPERMQQDIAKFRELLGMDTQWMGGGTWPHGMGDTIQVLSGIGIKAEPEPVTIELTIDGALSLLSAEAAKSPLHKARLMKRITAALKAEAKPEQSKLKRGRPKKEKSLLQVSQELEQRLQEKPFILAVQTYPGGNDAIYRHAPLFDNAGASRIVAITTTDGKCIYPAAWDEVQIGDNKYIQGDHLPRRVLGILEWFLKQPEDLIVIAEYDNLFPKPIQPWEGLMLSKAGGKLPDSEASTFFHTPWMIDKKSAECLIEEMKGVIRDGICNHGPEASPDVFLSCAVDRADIPFKEFHMFTRNTITSQEDKEKARKAFREGQPVHGVKTQEVFDFITK